MRFKAEVKEYTLPFLISILPIVAVFCSEKILSFLIILVVIFSIFEKNKWTNFKNNFVFLKPYLAFVIFCVIATLLSKDFFVSIKSLERYISLILLPILFFSSNLDEKRLLFTLRVFIISMVLVSLLSVGRLIWFVNVFGDWIEIMNNANKNDVYLQFKYPHLMWDVHPTYWSYLIVIVNVILLNNKDFNRVFNNRIVIALLVVFNFNLFYLAARVPLFVNICIHLVYLSIYFKKNIKLLGLTYIFIAIVAILAYFQLPFLKYKIHGIIGDDRFFLWDVVYETAKSNYFMLGEGFGLGGDFIANYLDAILDPRNDYKGIEIHNQYLTMLLETGVLGVIVLLYVYIKPAISFGKDKKKWISLPVATISFLVVFASVIEPFFKVIKGIIIFTVFSVIFRLLTERMKKIK